MICIECKNGIYGQGSSTGNCIKCNKEIFSMYTPCYKVCKECADKLMLCEQCGDIMAISKSEFKRIKIQRGEYKV